jgi:hypothetical protein
MTVKIGDPADIAALARPSHICYSQRHLGFVAALCEPGQALLTML